MLLNTLAGRTYNDLRQYPVRHPRWASSNSCQVFPWVIADYKSQHLDLTAPSTYRDLSKPIAALEENRLAQFQQRYQQSRAENEEFAAHHHTHYSSYHSVLFYLERVQPFTALKVSLACSTS